MIADTYQFDPKVSSAVSRAAPATGPLSPDELERMQRYWHAVNYLTVAQIYLLESRGLTPAELHRLVNQQAGLRGVSETSSDMQSLLDREASDPRAADAVELFCYLARKSLGGLVASLSGLDTLVFTAGIGENSAIIRERICEAAAWLGVKIDPERNRRGDTTISAQGSAVDILVVPTDEERAVAKQISSSPS